MTLLHPHALFLLPLAILLGLLAREGERKNAEWRQTWGQTARIGTKRGAIRPETARPWILGGCAALIVVALARPVWNPQSVEAKTSGQDTVFLIDVSRSMDTADLSGMSRLDAVKQAILELLPVLEGDRVALVAFAGTAVPKCPLTRDYAFFRQSAQLLDTASTSRGGTLFGDALRAVRKDFAAPGKKLAVWAFTDGGDQESFPVEAAREYADAGISLYVWGVGTLEGGEVPERGVSSALNESLLREVASSVPGGAYFGRETGLWSLEREYRARHRDTEASASSRVVWTEGSWYLLWPIVALALADLAFSLAPRMKRRRT